MPTLARILRLAILEYITIPKRLSCMSLHLAYLPLTTKSSIVSVSFAVTSFYSTTQLRTPILLGSIGARVVKLAIFTLAGSRLVRH